MGRPLKINGYETKNTTSEFQPQTCMERRFESGEIPVAENFNRNLNYFKEYKLMKDKYQNLLKRSETLELNFEKSKKEARKLKTQILQQTKFCTTLGLVLGNLSWNASFHGRIIKEWIDRHENRLLEFLNIMNGTFVSFINTYNTALPSTDNIESQFIINLLGIVSNLTANSEGKKFIVLHSAGQDLLYRLVVLFPIVPITSKSGCYIKRLILTILCNISTNKIGMMYLFELKIGDILSPCLEDFSPLDLKLLCLRLLQSLTSGVSCAKDLQHIKESVKGSIIKKLSAEQDEIISTIATEIMNFW